MLRFRDSGKYICIKLLELLIYLFIVHLGSLEIILFVEIQYLCTYLMVHE